jgi:hypothetical protein
MLTDLYNSEWLAWDECDVTNYLYQSRVRSQPIFLRIEEDMAQLNDFCVLCIEGTDRNLTELQDTLRGIRSGELRLVAHPDYDILAQSQGYKEEGDVSDGYADCLEKYDIPRYQEMQRFMLRAMSLLLLSAFSEKSLKDLADCLAPPEAPRFKKWKKKKGNLAEVSALMSYLKDICALEFEEPEASRLVREKCQRIRNHFAHGRWDNVKRGIADYPLRTAFSAVTALFDAIDAAFRQSNPDHASAGEVDPVPF